MPTTVLLGSTGVLGRRVAGRLAEAGHDLVAVVRDPATADRVVRPAAADARISLLGPTGGTAAWRDAIAGADVVVSTLSAGDGAAADAVSAVIDTGAVLVDAADAPRHLSATYGREAEAVASGAVIVPGIGWRTAVGDLLTAVAADRVDQPRAVHVAAVVPDRGGVLRAASPGVRAGLAAALGDPVLVVDHGERSEEVAGESRRLAWFPRPFGPHHAAGFPGLEPLSVPQHLSDVTTVRSYVAVSSARAELLQAAAAWSRRDAVRRRLAARLLRGASTTGSRWAVVAEVAGADDQLARAWANGRDHLDASARLIVAVATAVGDRRPAAGVLAPARAADPRDLLDAVAARSEVRWSVADPRRR